MIGQPMQAQGPGNIPPAPEGAMDTAAIGVDAVVSAMTTLQQFALARKEAGDPRGDQIIQALQGIISAVGGQAPAGAPPGPPGMAPPPPPPPPPPQAPQVPRGTMAPRDRRGAVPQNINAARGSVPVI